MPEATPDSLVSRRAALRGLGRGTLIVGTTGWSWACREDGTCQTSGCATACDVEGPFYTADAPLRDALADDGQAGERVTLMGRILDATDCSTPLVGYILDLWHADANGNYDNEGFTLRGRFPTTAQGEFVIETIVPGLYPDRPVRHIHVKVRDPEGVELLTTQLYFDADTDVPLTGPVVEIVDSIVDVDFVVDR